VIVLAASFFSLLLFLNYVCCWLCVSNLYSNVCFLLKVSLILQDDKVPKFVQISPETYAHLTDSEEQVKVLDEKVKILNEKLSASESEITTKDALVKQHAKVAEEAVSGAQKISIFILSFWGLGRRIYSLCHLSFTLPSSFSYKTIQ
jgi:hypothetical protein